MIDYLFIDDSSNSSGFVFSVDASPFDTGRSHFDPGAQASCSQSKKYLHGYKAFGLTSPTINPVGATGDKRPAIGYGLQLHRNHDGTQVPVLALHTPNMNCDIMAPASF